ncbi:DUF4350 domain-containing protein [bacterium]|nr:DUF4350 domain-containing protein [bacterium]
MRSRTALILSAIIILVLIGAFYQTAATATRGGNDTPLYSIRRYDPYGTAALFEVLKETGHEVHLRENAHFDDSMKGVLLQILAEKDRDRIDEKELLRWVNDGNSVVIFSRTLPEIAAELGLGYRTKGIPPDGKASERLEREMTPPRERLSETAKVVDPRFSTAEDVTLVDPVPFEPTDEESAWRPFLKNEQGKLGWTRRHGAGEVIVIGSPTLALNGWLSDRGNIELLLKLSEGKTVYLDEWAHGFGSGGTIVGLLRDFGLTPLLLQLAFVVGLFAWNGRGQKLTDPPMKHRGRSSVEQIKTLGYLYSQSMNPKRSLELVNKEVRRRLTEKYHTTPEQLPHRLTALLGKSDPNDQRQISEWLTTLDRWEQQLPSLPTRKFEADLSRLLTESHRLLVEGQSERH